MMAFAFENDIDGLNSECIYYDVSSLSNDLTNSIMHLNIRSVLHKTAELALLTNEFC